MKKYLSLLPSVLLLIGTLAAYGQSTGVAERDVTILESIKSTGLQAFNTGYTHKANTRVVMDCEATQNTQRNWEALLGARLSDYISNAFCFFSRHYNYSASAVQDSPCFNRSGNVKSGSGFVYGERILLSCEGQTATWFRYSDQSTAVGSVTTTGTADDGKTPMFLFDLNTSATEGGLKQDNSKSVMTLYGCRIYEGETLKCDFVPARYNGKAGLYDRVNHTFSGSLTDTPFFAPDLANYERALNAIVDGHKYRVFTEVGGLKYYVTADGYLTTDMASAPAFQINKVAGYEYAYGFQLKNGNICFTNPRTYSVAALTEGHLNTADRTDGPRSDWEAQVFFLNEQGKYAIRSTNARSGDTEWSWIGCAYWTVNEGPLAEYGFDMNYVWQLEDGSVPVTVTETTTVLGGDLTYKVTGVVNLDTRLRVNGRPTLVLDKGATLNAPMGIEVSYSPEECTLTIEGSGALNAFAENGDAAIGGSRGNRCGTVIIHGGQITVNSGDNSVGIGPGQWGDVHFGYLTLGWTNPSDFVSVNSVKFYNTDRISFAEGKKFLVDGTDTEATTDNIAGQKLLPMTSDVITESTTLLGDGCTYYVNTDVTNANRIRVMGSAVLHLGEGATLTATKGFQVEDDNTLTIEGDGVLIATASTHDAAIGGGDGSGSVRDVPYGHIIINGGNVTATGGEDGAGIGGGVMNRPGTGSITINGGVVNATGGKEAAGIGGGANFWYSSPDYAECGTAGTIIINGGQVTATGGTDDSNALYAGIGRGLNGPDDGQLTLGWTLESDYLQANSYDAGTVTFAQGKFFAVYTEGTKITPENIATANGKKLVPWFEPGTIDLSALTSDRKARNGDLVTGRLSGNYKISIADGATVTLRDVTINGVSEFDDDYSRLYEWAGISCEGDATIILEGENTVKGFFAYYPGIHVPEGKTLTIKGDGSLDASSNEFAVSIDGAIDIGGAAGIGGGYMLSCGNIVIEGGTITATGGELAAGIGSGCSAGETVSACGNITITGGTVTASSTKEAAGIGCGSGETGDIHSRCGDITITDQVNCVTAISPDRPFALGNSINGNCGKVTIGGIETGSIMMYKFVYNPNSVAEGVVNLLTLNNDYVAQNGDILYGILLADVRIKIADGATVTLRDASINSKQSRNFTWEAIECLGDATIILEGENEVVGGDSKAGIYVPANKTLTIKGTGSLNASNGNYFAAAIGGSKNTDCGNIVIEGGNIHAVGGQGAAGIGGPSGGRCGDITITGGTIYAESERFGAGIGSGRSGSCGNITITGGDIYAKGGEIAAGIGTAAAFNEGESSRCGDITITDGITSVVAVGPNGLLYGTNAQLPIGAGDGGTCGTVTISQNLDDVIEDYEVDDYNKGKKRTLTRRIIPGDVNGDNKVTPADAIMILYYYFGVNQNGFVLGAADLNGDTKITPADAIEALYKYFGVGTGNSNARANRPTANDSRDPE
ncbi:MAG: dockerin type I repeat-containing protein [Prevotella sp.]|nr:dockerin type I repeat-containing protein [Prevotella sp.]